MEDFDLAFSNFFAAKKKLEEHIITNVDLVKDGESHIDALFRHLKSDSALFRISPTSIDEKFLFALLESRKSNLVYDEVIESSRQYDWSYFFEVMLKDSPIRRNNKKLRLIFESLPNVIVSNYY